MAEIGLAASVIAVLHLTESCLKASRQWLGPSEFRSSDRTAMITALYEFNGALKTFETCLKIHEDNEARLRSLDHLTPTLQRCEEALNILQDFIERSGFVGKYVVGPKFDKKLKASLKALDGAKELFMLALLGDQQ